MASLASIVFAAEQKVHMHGLQDLRNGGVPLVRRSDEG